MDNKPNGNASPTEEVQGETESQPQYVTAETLNRAITARFKTFEQKLDKLFSQTQQVSAPTEQESKPKSGLEEMRAELEKIKRERDEERNRNKSTKLEQSLYESLSEAGITNRTTQKMAVGHLTKVSNSVGYDDDGETIVFKHEGETFNLKDGLKQWLSTSEDAKLFRPAKVASGSGDKSSHTSLKQPSKVSKEELAEDLAKALFNR
jgi:hypothetical protein